MVQRHPGARLDQRIAAGAVVARPRPRAGVFDEPVAVRHRGGEGAAERVAVGAGEGGDPAVHGEGVGGGEQRRLRRDDDRSGDRIATLRHRGDTGEHLDLPDRIGVDVGQRRIHVIAAGRGDGHAHGQHVDAIVGEAAHHRQAGDAAAGGGLHAGNGGQHRRGVGGGHARADERGAGEGEGGERLRRAPFGLGRGGRPVGGDDHLGQGGGVGLLRRGEGGRRRENDGEREERGAPHQTNTGHGCLPETARAEIGANGRDRATSGLESRDRRGARRDQERAGGARPRMWSSRRGATTASTVTRQSATRAVVVGPNETATSGGGARPPAAVIWHRPQASP